MGMFCFQCEQTIKGSGCIIAGQCGKGPDTAAVQDLVLHACKALAQYTYRARQLGRRDPEIDRFLLEAMFSTLTNVNFDTARLGRMADTLAGMRDQARQMYLDASTAAGSTPASMDGPADWQPRVELEQKVRQAAAVGIMARRERTDENVLSLQELITYGLKGLCAYAYHAAILETEDPAVHDFIHEALNFLTEDHDVPQLTAMALRVGETNLRVMQLLDQANTGAYGDPEPTQVRVTPIQGKAILVSGHDLKDLEALLQQTAGRGINVYTHGEMLPAHGYPGLKRFAHLAGNYGGAWQNQFTEFAAFPGAILMTTNCIQRPDRSYADRIFTCGTVGWPDVTHIEDRDFGPVIEAALAQPGFAEDGPEQRITVGFGHHAILSAAETVVQAVKDGQIRHFFLIGGCDGARPGRNYFTDMAQAVPEDCLILTLGCGKYRFNKLELGQVAGLPRLLDMGQCNDAYGAIQVAAALAKAFDTDVNGLPLTLVLSWYEQKAVAILLTLLHLGIKNMRLGPSLPAFLSKAVLNLLVENYALTPISTPERDLQAILG